MSFLYTFQLKALTFRKDRGVFSGETLEHVKCTLSRLLCATVVESSDHDAEFVEMTKETTSRKSLAYEQCNRTL